MKVDYMKYLQTNICIVGGGPSGLLLGLLLAKQGIKVTVLEAQFKL
jgi:2-polyprenyl-6-methoxyphenol hydroxylase-like FAD-dependent oxidoreductase